MLSALFIGNYTIFYYLFFFLFTRVAIINTLDLMNPDTLKRVKSKRFYQTLNRLITYTVISILCILFIQGFSFYWNKDINLLNMNLIGLTLTGFQSLVVYKIIFVKLSDLELKILSVQNINYDSNKTKAFVKTKRTINILTFVNVVGVASLNLLNGVYMNILGFGLSTLVFILIFILSTLLFVQISSSLDKLEKEVLSFEKGYISKEQLDKMKEENALKNLEHSEIKTLLEKYKKK